MKKLIYSILFILLPCVVVAAPSISSDNGATYSDGNSVTISGSSFGSGPNVVIFDDFEGGTNDTPINTGSGSANYGQWNSICGLPYYTSSASVSGNMAFQADTTETEGGCSGKHLAEVLLPANTRDIFLSYWIYIPEGESWPGHGNDDNINWKIVWVLGDGTYGDDDMVFFTVLGSGETGEVSSFLINGNEGDPGYTKYTWMNFTFGQWKRLTFWYKGGYEDDGQCHYWELTNSGVVQRVNDNNVNTLKSGGAFERVDINGLTRRTKDGNQCHTTFDDFYVATGANARARVEIGNNASYNSCTALAISTPTAWSTTSITATFNQGSFNLNDTAYLFVIDADGDASNGYPISIGGTDTAPPAITNLLPTNGSSTETASQTLSANVNDSSGVVNVRYSTSDISYASMGSGGDMSQSGSTWTKGVILSLGSNTYYIAAIDTLDNVTTSNASTTVTLTEGGDTTAPEVTAFVIPAASSSLTFSITTFTATDVVGVTGYLITESATPPSAGDAGWSASVPSSYTAASGGAHTLYAWAKDAGSNISDSLNDSVTITISSLPGGETDFSPTGDTTLNVNTTNYSTDTNLKVYSWPSNEPSNTAILVFDTSAYSAQGIVHSATLKLFVEESGGDAAMNVAVARLNVDPVVAQATGEVYAAGSDWTSPSPRQTAPFSELGLMNIAAPSDIVSIEAALGQYKNFDVTSIVQKAVAENDPTFAMLVYPSGDMSSDTYRYFSSQDHATAGQRPVLTVTFQHAGGNSASGGEVR